MYLVNKLILMDYHWDRSWRGSQYGDGGVGGDCGGGVGAEAGELYTGSLFYLYLDDNLLLHEHTTSSWI